LIRKKPDLAVESWIDEGRAIEAEVTSDTQEDPEKFWKWAVEWVEDRLDTYVRQESQVLYTEEEIAMGIENIRTGLRHSLDSEGSDEEDEDDEMEDVEMNVTEVTSRAGGVEFGMGKSKQSTESPGKPTEEILKFSTGANGVGLGIDFATL
jgi:mediator of RNA polymerase II transcription subunit 8